MLDLMKVGKYKFEHICDITPMRGSDNVVQMFIPQH